MFKTLYLVAVSALTLSAQYKTEPAGPPPAEASALAGALVQDGIRILKPDATPLLELWLVKAAPAGGSAEQNASFSTIPHGALIGVIRYPARHKDRRNQTLTPGVYSARYSIFPMNGDHQGVAPQRDFLLLSPIAGDTDPAAKPNFDELVTMSRKASGTPHPLVLSVWKDDDGAAPGIAQEGEEDQVLHTKIGSVPLAIIVVGVHRD
jgi:hypothetical protein